MNIQTATPAEIDGKLAEIQNRVAKISMGIDRRVSWILAAQNSLAGKTIGYYADQTRERLAKLNTELTELTELRASTRAEAAPFDAEFIARGGWTRYYLVQNGNGHVHPNTDTTCSRDRNTSHYWLTEQSGMSAAELIELAGEAVCTVCFPDAPVNVLNQPTRLEAPERKAARIERETKRAAAAAKKAAKAIPATTFTCQGRYKEKVETISAARSRLTDHYQYVECLNWKEFITAGLDDLVNVIADKEGKTSDQVIAEARKRAAKR